MVLSLGLQTCIMKTKEQTLYLKLVVLMLSFHNSNGQHSSPSVQFLWEKFEGNLRSANIEPSMHFMRANIENQVLPSSFTYINLFILGYRSIKTMIDSLRSIIGSWMRPIMFIWIGQNMKSFFDAQKKIYIYHPMTLKSCLHPVLYALKGQHLF